MNNMNNYQPFYNYPQNYNPKEYPKNNDERLIGGGFAFPFLLGGVTGAAIAPAFWGGGYGYNRPYYRPYYGPYPGPYYGPYR